MGLFETVLSNVVSQLGPSSGEDQPEDEYGPVLRRARPMPGSREAPETAFAPFTPPRVDAGSHSMPGSSVGDAQHPSFASSTPPLAHSEQGATSIGSSKAGDWGQTVNASRQVRPPATTASAAMPPVAAPAATPAPPAAATPTATPAAGPAGALPVQPAATPPLTAPIYNPVDFNRRRELAQQRDKLTLPNDPNAKQFRPGLGRKIGAALLGFADSFAGDPEAAQLVQSVLRAKFNQAESQRKAKLDVAEKDVSDFDKESGERRSDFESQNAAATTGINAAREKREQEERDAEAKRKQTADDNTPTGRPYWNKKGELVQGTKGGAEVPYTPKNVEEGAILEQENKRPGKYTQMWDKEKKNQPTTHAQGETEYRDWVTQWKREHKGQAPSAQAIQRFKAGLDPDSGDPVKPDKKRGTPEQFQKVEKDKKKTLKDAEDDFALAQSEAAAARKRGNNALADQLEKSAKDDLQKAKDQAQSDYETGIANLGGTAGANAPNPSGKGNASAAPGRAAHKVGDIVTVKGQKVRITKILANGKYEGESAE